MRVLSGIQPTGNVHIGNYLGAIKTWVDSQDTSDAFFTVVDLHAITMPQEPNALRRSVLETLSTLFAAGLDPTRCTIFLQSQIGAHAELTWLLQCTTTMGELNRMTQFKDKGKNNEGVRAGLFTYPTLMAADILLYQTDSVPVGDDQKQHIELCRDIAIRFNNSYGEVFRIPNPAIQSVGSRIMDLLDPTKKMSKSSTSQAGIIYLNDSPNEIKKKISRAVTDTENSVVYDPSKRPGISNLLDIFSSLTGQAPAAIAENYNQYGKLKADLTEIMVNVLAPIASRAHELLQDPTEVMRLTEIGHQKASKIAYETLDRAKTAMGFVLRHQ